MNIPSKEELLQDYEKIKPFINKTALINNQSIDKLSSSKIYFKCQNFQKTGSFKTRGAANKILSLQNPKIVCTYSSGNHAQAVAYMAQKLGIRSVIVMPKDIPQVKKNAVSEYGGQIHYGGSTPKQLSELSLKIRDQLNADFVHAHNDLKVISGGATVSMECYDEINDFDYIVFPIGGGGLASGTLISTSYFSEKTIPIGVQPYLARDAFLSLQKGQIQPPFPPITIADGLRTGISDITFSIMKKYLKDIILVSEEEMIEANQLIFERMKVVVQFSSSMVLAAILKDSRFKGKKVCAILTGGNIDIGSFFNKIKCSL